MGARNPDLGEFQELDDASELRRLLGNAHKTIRRLRGQSAALVEATHEAARDAMLEIGGVPKVKPPKPDTRTKRAEVALWHLTDWQGSKVTTSYNSAIMRERVMRYCEKAATLTEIQRSAHPVKKCVIMFGGDMGEGLFNFPSQPFEIDATLFEQFVSIARVEVDVVRHALALYDEVEVIEEWGNHGRVGNKRAVVPPSDNFDRMGYELARAILSDPITEELHPRLTWKTSAEDMQRVQIGKYRALLIHGDEIGRNGFASPTTIVKHVNQWKGGGLGWNFRDCYMGHYHNHGEFQLADGKGALYMTGSPESDNRYARDMMASISASTQRLHFIDPEKGRVTAQYKVELRDAS